MNTEDFIAPNGWFDFSRYLETIKKSDWVHKKEIIQLLREVRYCDSDSASFTDSLFRRIGVSVFNQAVSLTLLGPFFDRAYTFAFQAVSALRLPSFFCLGESLKRIVVYEVDDSLFFDFQLKGNPDSKISLACQGFTFSEAIMDTPLARNEGLGWSGESLPANRHTLTITTKPRARASTV